MKLPEPARVTMWGEHVYTADQMREALAWREAIDEALVVANLGTTDTPGYTEPREALNKLNKWLIEIALDPRVSSAAQKLRLDALEEAARVCDGVNNHDNPMTARDCADAIRALKEKTT